MDTRDRQSDTTVREGTPPSSFDPVSVSLTPTERKFVSEYLIDENGTRAYKTLHPRASYGAARMAASRLVAKDNVRAAIEATRSAQIQQLGISADEALQELCRIAFSDVVHVVDENDHPLPLKKIPLAARRTIASVEFREERTTTNRDGETTSTTRVSVVSYKLWPKLPALARLFGYLGLQGATLPPIEVLLSCLPSDLAAELRASLLSKMEHLHVA